MDDYGVIFCTRASARIRVKDLRCAEQAKYPRAPHLSCTLSYRFVNAESERLPSVLPYLHTPVRSRGLVHSLPQPFTIVMGGMPRALVHQGLPPMPQSLAGGAGRVPSPAAGTARRNRDCCQRYEEPSRAQRVDPVGRVGGWLDSRPDSCRKPGMTRAMT
jgi:hypothetical protein